MKIRPDAWTRRRSLQSTAVIFSRAFRGSLRTFKRILKVNYGETCTIFILRLLLKITVQ